MTPADSNILQNSRRLDFLNTHSFITSNWERLTVLTASVCSRAYLRNYVVSDLHQIFEHLTCVRDSYVRRRRCDTLRTSGSTDDVMLYITTRNRRRYRHSVGSSMDPSPWRILKLIHQGTAPDRGRSLLSTIGSSDFCSLER